MSDVMPDTPQVIALLAEIKENTASKVKHDMEEYIGTKLKEFREASDKQYAPAFPESRFADKWVENVLKGILVAVGGAVIMYLLRGGHL